ncbi:MAG TPA: valine--tRNA ligase [Blastocatellia bacterium]|nr:valine--tRNA ligase [Blastocatellia bacterium]
MAFTDYFEHSQREKEIYRRWEESGAFIADRNSDRPAFTISMPPPNATGTLHLGHSIMLAIEDLMIRWRRMAGYEALWVPGTDHAAIATENMVIKQLRAAGVADPRAELGREELVRQIAEFVKNSRSRIRSQIRAMGASCDWSRERYTMDEQLSRCVASVFARMFGDGLIYRGKRIINWDPSLQTTISDDEIQHVDREAKFYTLRYGPFLVGTSRPETKLGDTAVAVHPDDPRWQEHIGKTYEIHWPKGPTITVKVVADAQHVDPETGTGALGVTPAHSHVDFEIAQQHNLPLVQVIGEDGRMTEAAGPYAGMTVLECREAFVRDLREAGLLADVKTYVQQTSICYRSKQPIEPLPKDQWFIDVNKPAVRWRGKLLSLKQVLRSVVESGEIRIIPDHEEKKYFHWIDNLRDWCISRQIWWGHRIPVWYRGPEEFYVGYKQPEGEGWAQGPDTLDTWFSSALWTWSTLVDPEVAKDQSLSLTEILERSPDFHRFHPTSVMETGYDILFFWVARMILMTTYATGQIPFRTVYLHGMVLDIEGEKMSKNKPETSIDPLDEIEERGADPLRMAMILNSSPGRDTKLGKDQIEGAKRLVNKIWNAAKLVHRNVADKDVPELSAIAVEHPVNRWMLARVKQLIETMNARLEAYAFADAAENLRGSFWGEFCDFYLEAIKVEDLARRPETPATLLHVFGQYLRLFHPLMPFVTEQVWLELGQPGMLIRADWPAPDARHEWPEDLAGVDAVVRLISEIRRIRSEKGIEQRAKVNAVVQPRAYAGTFAECREIISRLARVEDLAIDTSPATTATTRRDATVGVDEAFSVAVSLGEADLRAEHARLSKQLESERQKLDALEKRLSNEGFVTRARPEMVEATRLEASKLRATITSIQERLESLT